MDTLTPPHYPTISLYPWAKTGQRNTKGLQKGLAAVAVSPIDSSITRQIDPITAYAADVGSLLCYLDVLDVLDVCAWQILPLRFSHPAIPPSS